MNEKIINNKVGFIIIGIIVVIIITIIMLIFINAKPKKVQIPNLVGLTLEDAKKEAKKAGLKISVVQQSKSEKKDVIDQDPPYQEYYTIKKGKTIGVVLGDAEEEKNKIIEEQQKEKQIEKTLSDFASQVRTYNGGSVKYESYSKYSRIGNETVYKIKYVTSFEYSYYYQLVSLDDDNKTVKKSTRLFSFYKYYGGEESGEKLELEYAFEDLWGNRT